MAERTCRYCGRDIELVPDGTGHWSAMERLDTGELVEHFPRCAGKEKHVAAAIQAKREAKARGFHGDALDKEISRIMRKPPHE